MAVYLVTYKLETPGKDYGPFYDELKKMANGWCHYIDNVWIINTEVPVLQLTQKLYPHMTKADLLIVTKLQGTHNGWLPKEAWDWLNARTY